MKRGLLVVLFLCACRGLDYPTTAETVQPYLVHGMLRPGAVEQRVIVERARAVSEGVLLDLTPVPNAQVIVTEENGASTTLAESGTAGVYAATFAVTSARRYLLRVETPDGIVITGATRVPEPPSILEPSKDTSLQQFAQTNLSWTRATVAAAYAIVDAPPGESESPNFVFSRITLRDTTARIGFGFFGATSMVLRIAAVDTNYAAYTSLRFGDNADRRRVRSTVAGGYGLFGSYALSGTRTITRQ